MEKQIEEMARELCSEGEYYQDCFHCPTLRCCGTQKFARELYDKGWCKASDVAREIFEEIEASAKVKYWRGGGLVVFEVNGEDFAELKKKYTQDKGRDKIAEFGKYSPLSWRNTEEGE